MQKEAVVAYFKLLSQNLRGGLMDTIKNSAGVKAKIHPEYRAEALLLEPICSMTPFSLLWRHISQDSKPHIGPM
jgi:hypothetical protein